MIDDLSQAVQNVRDFTDQAVGTLSIESKDTLDKLGSLVEDSGQKMNHFTTNLTQSLSGLEQATTTLKKSVLETTNQATGALDNATNVAVHKLNDAASSITETAEKTRLALDETLQKTEQLSQAIANSIQDVFVTSVKMWMAEHPILSWMFSHPLWTILGIIIALFLGWSLLTAVAQYSQQAWLSILQSPLKLIQLLFGKILAIFPKVDVIPKTNSENQQDAQTRLQEILNCLEELHQEQEALRKEMQAILLGKN